MVFLSFVGKPVKYTRHRKVDAWSCFVEIDKLPTNLLCFPLSTFYQSCTIEVEAHSPDPRCVLVFVFLQRLLRPLSDQGNEPQLSRHLALVERLREVGERHGTTPGAIAIAWTLSNPAVHGAVVGLRRPHQVEELALAGNVELGDEELALVTPRQPRILALAHPCWNRSESEALPTKWWRLAQTASIFRWESKNAD